MSGYTKISNEFFDWLMDQNVTSRQMKILLMVSRFTLCFHREFAEMSLSFIEQRTGILRRNAQTDIKSLLKMNLLRERMEGQKRFLSLNTTVLNFENSFEVTVLDFENRSVLDSENRTVLDFENKEIEKDKHKKINDQHQILFDQFWSIYPRKVSKPQAKRAFQTAMKKTTFEVILEGVNGYIIAIDKDRTETKFIKHPSTWLNAEAWNDNQPTEIVSRTLQLVQAQMDKEINHDNIRELYRKTGTKIVGSCSGVAR